jgi:3-methylcrotonyl-CoA carboxylase beta subunit
MPKIISDINTKSAEFLQNAANMQQLCAELEQIISSMASRPQLTSSRVQSQSSTAQPPSSTAQPPSSIAQPPSSIAQPPSSIAQPPSSRALCAGSMDPADKPRDDVSVARDDVVAARDDISAAGEKEAVQGPASKLPARVKLDKLLDSGSYFLELSQLAALNVYKETLPAAGLITGIGKVSDITCMIFINDHNVKGGAFYPLTVKKFLRAQEIAQENDLPCLYLIDSAGAALPYQDEAFPDKEHFGRIFYNEARMSQLGIPQIAAIFGASVAGSSYIAVMADESIMVKDKATLFLAGPQLLKAATGETIAAQDLGGASMHCQTSGSADNLAIDEEHAIVMLRDSVKNLNYNPKPSKTSKPPAYPSDNLIGLASFDLKKPQDTYGIIAHIVDDSEFSEFKALYGKTLICGFAKIYGHKVGIIANNGVLLSESALKGTHFIQLCCQRNIPIIFLQNITGFMVGRDYEKSGIGKHGATMVNAVSTALVPKITVIIGSSFGAGNYAMCGRAYSPRFLWTWPNARIGVMGDEQAYHVMSGISKSQDKKQLLAFKERMKQQTSCYYASARIWDDGIIMPQDTRKVLGLCLEVVRTEKAATSYGVFRM